MAKADARVEDKSQLILTILAIVLSALAIGLYIEQRSGLERERRLQEQLTTEKIARGMAEAKAAMQEQVAEAKQIANAGREHARIALSEVERANAELAAKGLIRKSEH